MGYREVITAFEILMGEIKNFLDSINQEGAEELINGRYELAHKIMEKGLQINIFNNKVKNLQAEWSTLFTSYQKKRSLSYQKNDQFEDSILLSKKYPDKLKRGLKTPENHYYVPILQALIELGGSASVTAVLDLVEVKMKHYLNDYDFQPIPSKPTQARWNNTARWARYTLITQGLLSSSSPIGIWEITEAGKIWLENAK